MSKKTDLVYTEFYAPFLSGGRKSNSANNKQVVTERMYMRVLSELCMNRF